MTHLLFAAAFAMPAATTVVHHGHRYTVLTLDLREVTVDLVGQRGGPRAFDELPDGVAATNAGIFHSPDRPVGLWAEDGRVLHALERGDGAGNFFMKPNGVFWIDGDGAHIDDAARFVAPPTLRIATQSGPLLVDDGVLHPALQPDSPSMKLRSAIGVDGPWRVHWVVSAEPVRFHDLATLLRDVLGATDALYLDGTISGMAADGAPVPPDEAYAGFLVAADRAPAVGLADGDVVFQRSTSEQAAAIRAATGSPWTHVGLVRRIDGEAWVLEAVQPVRLTRYADWAARGMNGEVVAVRWAEPVWTEAARTRLDALQAQWLGRPYDARFAEGDAALYCSELVREAYLRAAEVELAPLRPLHSYAVGAPEIRAAIVDRWGAVPGDLQVVAPSDLLAAEGWLTVRP